MAIRELGWMRISDLDTSRGDDCPTGWTKTTTANDGMNPATDVCRSPNLMMMTDVILPASLSMEPAIIRCVVK